MLKKFLFALIFLTFTSSIVTADSDHPKTLAQETTPKAFKILKEKSMDPRTGLPKTLDPSLFKGKAKQAYQIAKEIPEALAQIPCFCECEAFGHENLLDCFIDRHGAG
jgi:ABC-type transporter MlaC component